MDSTIHALATGHNLVARSGGINPDTASKPPSHKIIGIVLAITAGLFIGTSFVIKKVGLLKANVKYNEEAGEGYGYLKNAWWWLGMSMMIVGEICNFAAYAFVDAILVTTLGALSVVIAAILSAIFLKERLSFVGKIGCFMCIVGSVVIVMNAPKQSSAATIQQVKKFMIAPGFLTFAGIIIVGCIFVALWVAPRYGKKSMMVYLTICSLIGGLSVVAIQGLGAAIVTHIGGTPQFNQWFLYVLMVVVVVTLVTEIIYLNKALNIYNAAMVTPTYYVFFTSATIVTSAILFRGFKGTPGSIITVVMGFLQICCGVVLLQFSKSAKDIPDAAVFNGDLDQVRTVAEQEQPESEPKADAIRGTAALIRRISMSRQKMEAEEARRLHEERLKDLEPLREGEQFEWDGLRRRRTMSTKSDIPGGSIRRQKTLHPPLGMSRMPTDEDDSVPERARSTRSGEEGEEGHGNHMFGFMRGRQWSVWRKGTSSRDGDIERPNTGGSSTHQMPLTEMSVPALRVDGPSGTHQTNQTWASLPPLPQTSSQAGESVEDQTQGGGGEGGGRPRGMSLRWASDASVPRRPSTSGTSPPPRPPPHTAKRQFSFQNIFLRSPRDPHRPTSAHDHDGASDDGPARSRSRLGIGSRRGSNSQPTKAPKRKSATEEERLGLVQGDSSSKLNLPDYASDDDDEDDWRTPSGSGSGSMAEKDVFSESEFSGEGGGKGKMMEKMGYVHRDEDTAYHSPRELISPVDTSRGEVPKREFREQTRWHDDDEERGGYAHERGYVHVGGGHGRGHGSGGSGRGSGGVDEKEPEIEIEKRKGHARMESETPSYTTTSGSGSPGSDDELNGVLKDWEGRGARRWDDGSGGGSGNGGRRGEGGAFI
ncbi:MAG: hypothetical protein M1823_003875 [Watsoniomyces obsoletus]|nr:MAG: hypothetical protein M1823_003875 [Watsoniomyces obsoletus]